MNPVLIFEVLYTSTEAYDRGDKFTYYKSIQSLREYLLIAQHRPHITHYSRQNDGSWSYDEVNEINGNVYLPALEVTLALSNLYRGVQFESN